MRTLPVYLLAASLAAASCTKTTAPSDAGKDVAATSKAVTSGATAATTDPNAESNRTTAQIEITDLTEGKGDAVSPGQTVSIHYVGALADGSKFDSSRDRNQPFSFKLGAGQVIAGLDQGVLGMKLGGKRKIIIPSILAYGNNGVGKVIPPKATLTFDVELLDVKTDASMAAEIAATQTAQKAAIQAAAAAAKPTAGTAPTAQAGSDQTKKPTATAMPSNATGTEQK